MVAALAVSGVAAADPLPVAVRAGDANLEAEGPHTGLTLTLALLGSTVVAIDGTSDVGRGPGVSFRLGEAATPDSVVTLELTLGSMLHQSETNNAGLLLLGGQYFAKQSLWVRGATGLGAYTRRQSVNGMTVDSNIAGPAVLVGAGLDIVRRHKFAFGAELYIAGIVDSTGIVTVSGLGFDIGYQ
jgi:hypothetical protein